MSNWEERITRETPPATRAEHELRYRLVAPLVATSEVWADLGCGQGVAAAWAFDGRLPQHQVLVDMDADAVAHAAAELQSSHTVQIAGDLSDPTVLARIEEELVGVEGDRVVTCFEVVEHLTTFVPLLEWAGELARTQAATFVISVPNDAFWSIQNPFHAGRWGEGAFDELRRLLPDEQTLVRQVSLAGSALVDWDVTPERHALTVDVGDGRTVATHFLAAFGPRHRELTPGALAVATDQLEQRRWERQRESNLALLEAQVEAQRAEREQWRAYIHKLEHELGHPLSGVESGQPDP